MTAKPFRVTCLVPGCRHTKGLDYDPVEWMWEWICAQHWRLVSRRLKASKTRLRRRFHRLLASAIDSRPSPINDGGAWYRDPLAEPPVTRWVRYKDDTDFAEHWRLTRALKWIWRRMRKQAIERAMGI